MLSVETQIETFIKSARNSSIGRQVVPMEAITGWPIPFEQNGKLFFKLLYFGVGRKEKGKTELFPPCVMLVLNYKTGEVVEYTNFYFSSPWPEMKRDVPVGYFPHPAVAGMRLSEYRQQKKELMIMYDQLIEAFLNHKQPGDEWNDKFFGILAILLEPSLRRFYQTMGGDFFNKL
jgi:hypothetical protein